MGHEPDVHLLFDRGEFVDISDFALTKRDSATLSNLDGFLTAVAIGPEPMPPSDWIARACGTEDMDFLSDEESKFLVRYVLLGRLNEIRQQLSDDPYGYEPRFWENGLGDVVVDDWVAGFRDGVAMQYEGWQALFESDARPYFVPIAVHIKDAAGNRPLRPDGDDEINDLVAQAAAMIPEGVVGIYWFFEQRRAYRQGRTKLGRNDPCFCGSGKKFKKCCGGH